MKKETETTLFTTEATPQKQHTTQTHSILIRCHFGPLLVFATCIGVRTLHVTVAVRCSAVLFFNINRPIRSSLLTMTDTVVCTVCKEVVQRREVARGKCLSCQGTASCSDGTFRVRLTRALKSLKDGNDPSIVDNFSSLSSAEKTNFKRLHHDKLGNHLIMAIQQKVKTTRRTEIQQGAISRGHMKDEADLTAKYGHKPDQLAAIFANADSFTCPIRACKMWADPDFHTEWNFTQFEESDETQTLATDDVERAAKKQKTEQTEKAPPTEDELKELKSADLEKLKELLAPIMEELNKYEESVAKATQEEFEEYIPKKYVLKMHQTKSRDLRQSGRGLMYT